MNENLNNIVGSETNIYIQWYRDIVTFNWISQYEFLFNFDSGDDMGWHKSWYTNEFPKTDIDGIEFDMNRHSHYKFSISPTVRHGSWAFAII